MINFLHVRSVVCIMLLGTMPACIKYHKVIKSEFPQGEDIADVGELAHDYVRSATVYDQFTTLAIFDALWVSPEVAAAYAELYGKRRGKSASECEALRQEKAQERSQYVSFYVLADLRVKTHKKLDEKDSYWTIALENTHGRRVQATRIKNVELDPEYQLFFGNKFSLFKEAYLVTFPSSFFGQQGIRQGEPLTMVLSSPRKSIRMAWLDGSSKSQKKKLCAYDTCDWF